MISQSPHARDPLFEPEPQEPPFAPTAIEELLRLIVKAARAHQMYLPNNPIYRGATDALRASFAPVWAETDEVVLTVLEGEIQWYGAKVAGQGAASRGPDNLGWLFYKDGIREVTLLRGFEEEEVVRFLDILKRARKGAADEDDLVTMLWEADFVGLKYKFVDLLQEGGGGDVADGTEVTPAAPGEVHRATAEAVAESHASRIVNISAFDSTLYFLDDREIEYLHAEIRREYEQDLRSNIVSVLLDIFEAQESDEVRSEVIEHLHTLMINLLTTGHYRGVANVLREGEIALRRVPNVAQVHRDRLNEFPDRLSAPEALTQILQALDESPSLPPQAELEELFGQLRPAALATVFRGLARSQNDALRPLLEAAAGRLAASNTSELVRLIQSSDAAVSAEAIRRAGGLRAQAAVLALGRILNEPDSARRLLAVQALTQIGSPGALQSLERAIEDPDRDVRVTAVRALAASVYRPALPRLESVVKGKAIRDADRTEKMAFFEGYGALSGDSGIPLLDSLLNGKGFLARRGDPEIRACAAMALGRVGTPRALDVLRRASAEKDVVVRSAVTRALKGGST